MSVVKLGEFPVGNDARPYIIAEVGANHNGDMDLARKLVDEAVRIGCDCVKFQTWTKDTIFSKVNYRENFFYKDDYRRRNDYSLEEIVDAFSLSQEQFVKIKDYCDERGIQFAASVFSRGEADLVVDELGAPFVKIASMDVTNLPFLSYLGGKGVPLVLSTGMATLEEVDAAIRTIEETGNRDIVILHCISNYPPEDANISLNNMDALRCCYPDYPVGYSDHSLGVEIPLAAVAKGACMLEKHFTLDRNMFGWDHQVSADPREMEAMVRGIRRVRDALGTTRRELTREDFARREAYRRSIVSSRDLSAGELIREEDLDFKRPGTGISPADLRHVVGRRLAKAISADELILWEDLA